VLVFGFVMRDFSGPKSLQYGCHGWLTNIRRFRD